MALFTNHKTVFNGRNSIKDGSRKTTGGFTKMKFYINIKDKNNIKNGIVVFNYIVGLFLILAREFPFGLGLIVITYLAVIYENNKK
jgi:hypothetical protein